MKLITTCITTTTAILAAGTLAMAPLPIEPDGIDEENPESVVLTGVIRDFKERTVENGHPDFERRPDSGFGQYVGNVSDTLDSEGKPVFTGNGFKLGNQWKDASGNNICWRHYQHVRLEEDNGLWALYYAAAFVAEVELRSLRQGLESLEERTRWSGCWWHRRGRRSQR